MNIIEAAKLMKQGRKVKLTGWLNDEYIYNNYDVIEDERGNEFGFSLRCLFAEDWEEYKEKCKCNKLHTFEEALEAFKNGESIKRDLWRIVDSKRKINKELYNKYSIMFTIDDFEANDWIILEN